MSISALKNKLFGVKAIDYNMPAKNVEVDLNKPPEQQFVQSEEESIRECKVYIKCEEMKLLVTMFKDWLKETDKQYEGKVLEYSQKLAVTSAQINTSTTLNTYFKKVGDAKDMLEKALKDRNESRKTGKDIAPINCSVYSTKDRKKTKASIKHIQVYTAGSIDKAIAARKEKYLDIKSSDYNVAVNVEIILDNKPVILKDIKLSDLCMDMNEKCEVNPPQLPTTLPVEQPEQPKQVEQANKAEQTPIFQEFGGGAKKSKKMRGGNTHISESDDVKAICE